MKNMISDSPSRIALFLPSLSGGGAERVMVEIANGLAGKGLEVDLVVGQAQGPYLHAIGKNVKLKELGARRVLRSLVPLIIYLRRSRPDVLISAMDYANTVAVAATRLGRRRTKAIVTVHSTVSRRVEHSSSFKERVVLFALRRLYRRAAAVVTVSEGAGADLRRITDLREGAITVIANPIPVSKIAERAMDTVAPLWPESDHCPTILACGRLVTAKNFVLLLEAFRNVRDQGSARLVILGEGPQRLLLEKRISALGLSNDVRMPGWVDNPFAYMRRANLFVSSSLWEGFGNVLVEALASGCPVVATDCPSGPAEILEGGKWGKLVPVGDPVGLGNAIIESLERPLEVPTTSYLEKRFGTQVALDRYFSLIESKVGTLALHPTASRQVEK